MDDEEEEESDGFIVPHGYLSDDEGVDGEEVRSRAFQAVLLIIQPNYLQDGEAVEKVGDDQKKLAANANTTPL